MTSPRNGARGQWLRDQRQARGWSIPHLARKLRESATRAGDTLPGPECLVTMIGRWEKGGGISERCQLRCCRALQIPPGDFGKTNTAGTSDGDKPGRVAVVIVVLPACRLRQTAGKPDNPT